MFALNIQKDEYMILKKLKFNRFLLTSADIVILPIIFNNKGMEISLRFIKYKTRGFLKKNFKGSVRKYERGYMLTAKMKRF